MEFILEQEKKSKFLYSKTTEKYNPSDEAFTDSEEHWWSSSNRCTRFLLKLFGKEYNRHKKLAKQLKERNNDIYKQIMVWEERINTSVVYLEST